jgi:hypothetical protein
MRILLILFLFSCTTTTRSLNTYSDNIKRCVYDLIGTYGIDAETSQKVCAKIYKRSK